MNGEALGQNIAERLVSTSHLSGKLKLGICNWSVFLLFGQLVQQIVISISTTYLVNYGQQLAMNPCIEAKFHGSAGDVLNGETPNQDE